MAKQEEFIRSEDIRTMKKDIVHLQRGGSEKDLSLPAVSVTERVDEHAEKKKMSKELQQMKRMEILRKEKEEREKVQQIQVDLEEKEVDLEKKKIEKQRMDAELKERERLVNLQKEADEEERLEKEQQAALLVEQKKKEVELEKERLEEQRAKEAEIEKQRLAEEQRRKVEQEKVRQIEIKKKKEERRIEMEKERKREEEEKIRLEEERKKKEAEEQRRRREDPEYKKKLLLQEEEKISERKRQLLVELERLADEKKPLEAPRKALLIEIEGIEEACSVISKREERAKEEKKELEEKEAMAKSPEERRNIEERRWKLEEKIKDLEQKRWPWDEKIEEANRKIEEIEKDFLEITERESLLKDKEREILKEEKSIKSELEKIRAEISIGEIEKERKSLEIEKNDLFAQLTDIESKLKNTLTKEKRAEEDQRLVEEEENLTKDLASRRKLEKERWELEEKRRTVEKERWELEIEQKRIDLQIGGVEKKSQALLEKASNLIERVKEIESILGIAKAKVEEAPPEPKMFAPASDLSVAKEVKLEKVETEIPIKKIEEVPIEKPAEAIRVEAMKEAKKRLEILKKQRGEEEEEAPMPKEEVQIPLEKEPPPPPDLPGEEIPELEPVPKPTEEDIAKAKKERTERMAKDAEVIKESLAGSELKEREPFSEQDIDTKRAKSFAFSKPIEVKGERPLPSKPSIREKLWVRVFFFALVLVLLAIVSTFWYWYLVIRKTPPPQEVACIENADCPSGQFCGSNKACTISSEEEICVTSADCLSSQFCNLEGSCKNKKVVVNIPPPLFLVDDERTLVISELGEIPDLILQTLQEYQDIGQVKRIIIQDKEDARAITLAEFFDALQVRMPNEFYDKVSKDFTLFIYSQIDGNRIGLVAETIERDSLSSLMASRETGLKDDLAPIFSLMEAGEPATVSYFRNANQVQGYVGPNFRFQTLAQNDLGLCYFISSENFVLTSSFKEMTEVISRLSISIPVVEIVSELKRGDEGDEIKLLQIWLAEDSTVYSADIVNGIYGPLTEEAVTKFQEKYSSEILAPQGLYAGTGVVDLYTRIKLNELYGKSGIVPKSIELITDLRYGDHSDEVRLLQIWLAKDAEIYPRGLTTGWFGPLTEAAVNRFQERYASEILAPQGLTRTTGIVDALTRQKLNQIYGQ